MPQLKVSVVDRIDDQNNFASALALCWMQVTNAGGAVGFPFPPIDLATATRAVRQLGDELAAGKRFVVTAVDGDELVGWVTVKLNPSPLTSHWGKLAHLQSHPSRRAEGVGAALLNHAADHARSLGLDQLILVARGGEGLEAFYEHHGWTEIGRHADALRFGEFDVRDEITMRLVLGAALRNRAAGE